MIMSSPHQQPLSLSQYTNMLTSSPLKPSSFYFQGEVNHGSQALHDENFRSTELNFQDPEFQNTTFIMPSSESGEQLVVPVSNNQSSQGQFLQYPPKFEMQNTAAYPQEYNQGFQLQDQMLPPQINVQQNSPPLSQQSQQPQVHQTPHQQHHYDHHQQLPQQQQQQQQQQLHMDLYPAMEFIPSQQSIKNSTSTNTLTSFESAPILAMSNSLSDTSIASPISYQNTTVTPRRPASGRRLSNATTTPLPMYQTPNQNHGHQYNHNNNASPVSYKTTATPTSRRPRHRRTRSRLSLDATGAASIVTTLNNSLPQQNTRSPAANTGTNPFYTPPAFLSPQVGSPAQTPLATPNLKKETSFSSISPTMLMNSQSLGNLQDHRQPKESAYLAAADLTVKMASKYMDQYNDAFQTIKLENFQVQQQNFIPEPFSELNNTKIASSIPETIAENSSRSSTRSSSVSTTASISKSILSRSHSSINLASIAAPPEIRHYDILTPRKKISKSQSATDINDQLKGKKPKKMHNCPICGAAFQRPEHVKRHMRSHSSEKPFECDEPGCGKRFNRPDNLKAHLRKIHHRPI